MNGSSVDQQLLAIVTGPPAATIPNVIQIMDRIDKVLPNQDGLKWFNLLYSMVTKEVQQNQPASSWADPAWLNRLDVIFANLYFSSVAGFLNQNANIPSSWTALFEARHRTDVDRIQFALAGMNAHINHDLSLALLQTDNELQITPALNSPERGDFEHVNDLLEAVLPSALRTLATGIVGELAQDTGKIGQLLAFWSVRAARDLAWDFADHLRSLTGLTRTFALEAQDKITGALGRSLLFSV